jgi:hypothetical protein
MDCYERVPTRKMHVDAWFLCTRLLQLQESPFESGFVSEHEYDWVLL